MTASVRTTIMTLKKLNAPVEKMALSLSRNKHMFVLPKDDRAS